MLPPKSNQTELGPLPPRVWVPLLAHRPRLDEHSALWLELLSNQLRAKSQASDSSVGRKPSTRLHRATQWYSKSNCRLNCKTWSLPEQLREVRSLSRRDVPKKLPQRLLSPSKRLRPLRRLRPHPLRLCRMPRLVIGIQLAGSIRQPGPS